MHRCCPDVIFMSNSRLRKRAALAHLGLQVQNKPYASILEATSFNTLHTQKG